MELSFITSSKSDPQLVISNPLSSVPSDGDSSHPIFQWLALNSIPPASTAADPTPLTSYHPSTSLSTQGYYLFTLSPSLPPSCSAEQTILLFENWIQTWNSFFFHHEGVIYKSCPLLHLFAFSLFHRTTWKFTTYLTIYVLLVLLFFGTFLGISFQIFALIFVNAFLNIIICPLVIKGMYSAESILSPPTPRSRLSPTRSLESPPATLFCSLRHLFFHLLPYQSTSPLVSSERDLESTQLLAIQDPISIIGIYYYLETMTAFLQDSSCKSYSFHASPSIPRLLVWFFYISLWVGIFTWWYHLFLYDRQCHGYGLHFNTTQYCILSSWQYLLLGYDIFVVFVLTMLSLMYFTMLTLLFYSAHLMISLMHSWTQRYKILRIIDKSTLEMEFKDSPSSHWMTIFPLLHRDAYERYLLIRYFAQEISQRWSTFIACSLILNTLCCVGGYFFVLLNYARYQVIDFISLILILYNAFSLLFIVFTVAYANSNVDQLKSHFIQSTENDYSLIGGRASWLEYIDQTPVYWTVFGFPITTTWIVSIFITIATAIIGIIGIPLLS